MPGLRECLVIQTAAAIFAVGIELVVLDDLACTIGDVLHTGLTIDDPYLLTCRRDVDANISSRLADEQTECVPLAVNARPVLIRCDMDGGRHRRYTWQKLVARRAGDVALDEIGGEAWCEEDGACECA
jgi:hypothetical protein